MSTEPGAGQLEYDLETLLRPKFRKNDNEGWARLTGENGPLSSFSQKVLMAEAFNIIDEPMRKNLNTLAAIRNAFAHSKKLINFDLPVIRKKLRGIYFPLHKKMLRKKLKEAFDPPYSRQATFIFICLIISTELQKGRTKVLKRRVQAKNRRMNKNPYLKALLNMSPIQRAFALPPLPASQSGDPTTQVPAQGIGDILERWASEPQR